MKNFNPEKETSLTGLYVEVKYNDFNRAYRKFKKMVQDDGILMDLRKREYYQSKGTKRRLAKQAAIRRYKKNLAKQTEI